VLDVAALNPVPELIPAEILSAFETCLDQGGIIWFKTNTATLFPLLKIGALVVSSPCRNI